MIVTGLRGVGKTVLLQTFREKADHGRSRSRSGRREGQLGCAGIGSIRFGRISRRGRGDGDTHSSSTFATNHNGRRWTATNRRACGRGISYSAGLFTFPEIGRLSIADASIALQRPSSDQGVTFTEDALIAAYDATGGTRTSSRSWGVAQQGRPRFRRGSSSRRNMATRASPSRISIGS